MNKRLGLTDPSATLAALSACRREMVGVLTAYPVRHPIYREANALIVDIDALATLLTGDPTYFQPAGHAGLARGR